MRCSQKNPGWFVGAAVVVLSGLFIVFSLKAQQISKAQQVLDRLVEHLKWNKYWLGSSGVDRYYIEGKRVKVLVFWSKLPEMGQMGICTPELGFCLAVEAPDYFPGHNVMQVSQNISAEDAFVSFVENDFNREKWTLPSGTPSKELTSSTSPENPRIQQYPVPYQMPASGLTQYFKVEDYDQEQLSIVLPILGLPSALVVRDASVARMQEAAKAKEWFGCGNTEEKRSPKCQGEAVFPFVSHSDPYWYVLVRCTSECRADLGNEIERVVALRRADEPHSWDAWSGGRVDDPPERQRFVQLIENAAMVRLPL